ncbi:MAG: aldo/keto reductase [Clostridia bacterium]|nr:aldo/keto reductase [Clostridia bacterium]
MKTYKKYFAIMLVGALMLAMCLPAMAAVYDDVPDGAWYSAGAEGLFERGIMNGTGGGRFSPEDTFTRAQLAAVMYRMAGSPEVSGEDDFTDTEAGAWYSDAVVWAAKNGIVNGYGGGLFGTNDPVTQEQLAVMLWRDAGSYDAGGDTETGASDYAVKAVRWLFSEKLINEAAPSFEPREAAKRAQVADTVYRYITLKEQYADAVSGATAKTEGQGQSGTAGGKMLVVYFSRAGENYNVGRITEGNTAKLAKEIAAQTGADLFEIVPETAYPEGYDDMLAAATDERKNNARPKIKTHIDNFESYDTVFIGYPIWWGDLPMIMHTFMESYDFTGKTVVPFNTHEGSGQAGTQSAIEEKLSGAKVLRGFAMQGSAAQALKCDGTNEAVKVWLSGLGINEKPAAANAFDLKKGTVKLNSGYEMPILGLGTFALSDSEAENSTYWALKAGFRLIDTARIYGNEAAVGRGLKRAIEEGIVTREEVFITTKMWTSDFSNGDAAIDASLERLDVDYIDLMILHHSQPSNDVEAYKAMERAVEAGKLKSIGLSNYYEPDDFDRLVRGTTIKPAVLQNETHPYHQSGEMKAHIAQYGTVLESWFPLGGRGNTQTLFNDETVKSIAAAHGVSSAQVIIRWHLQAGNICIPGSSNEQHIIEDYDVWDFELTESEMARMTALEKDARFADY